MATAAVTLILGSIISLELWTLFLLYWTCRVAYRVIQLHTDASETPTPGNHPSEFEELAKLKSDVLALTSPQAFLATRPRKELLGAATFHTRILQFLAGGLLFKTALIMLNIHSIHR